MLTYFWLLRTIIFVVGIIRLKAESVSRRILKPVKVHLVSHSKAHSDKIRENSQPIWGKKTNTEKAIIIKGKVFYLKVKFKKISTFSLERWEKEASILTASESVNKGQI